MGVLPFLSSCAFFEQEEHLATPFSSFGGCALCECRSEIKMLGPTRYTVHG